MRHTIRAAALAALICAVCSPSSSALTLEPLGEFEQPIFVSSDPADPERLLVVEREGRVIEVGAGGQRVLADLTAFVNCCDGERGLLSIAPASDFHGSGRFYAAYTGTPAAGGEEGDVHVDSFRPDPAGGPQPLREPVLSVPHAQFATHNGGQLQLGPDGYLYISLGDGGGGGDPLGSGQDVETLLGKVLRIDPHPGQVPPYAIPPGNPFAATAGRDEIWALGLRNPWRFSFDRATGGMVIGEVGQEEREEIDYAPTGSPGGANYGWNCREGLIPYPNAPAGCPLGGFTDPVFDYPHEDPGGGLAHGCSIIGGYVVRDASLGDLYGRYLYADLCTGEVRSLHLPGAVPGAATGDRSEGLTVAFPVSFGEDSCGRLYLVLGGGGVFRLAGDAPRSCAVATTSAAQAIARPRRPRLRLRATPIGSRGSRFRITILLSPCAEEAGREVRLKRGGKRIGAKRLNRRCVARAQLRILRRSTFRAILPADATDPRVRSPRLVVRPSEPPVQPGSRSGPSARLRR